MFCEIQIYFVLESIKYSLNLEMEWNDFHSRMASMIPLMNALFEFYTRNVQDKEKLTFDFWNTQTKILGA